MSYQLDQSKNALEIRVLETLNPTGKLSAHTFLETIVFPVHSPQNVPRFCPKLDLICT